MSRIKNVLIVGGGIGGLTAAIALRRQGIEAAIVEQNAEWSVYGVGIIQPNNTLRALDRIGLAQRCVESGASYPGWRIHDKHGRHLMDAPSTNAAAPDYPPVNGLTRPLLHKILSDAALAAGTVVRLGTSPESLEDTGPVVRATFTDGSQHEYDFVIGADGIYSWVRSQLFGDAFNPQYTGQSVWRHNLPRPPGVEWGEVYFGPDSKVGLVPMSKTQMYMFLVTAEPGNPWMAREQLALLMRQRLSAYTGLVAELRELITDPAGVVYKPMENVLVPAPWGKGRIMLIGDAAHASTPHLAQGAAMAIEDAVLLGELLGRDAQLEASLNEFTKRRFKRAQFVLDSSTQIATWELEEWAGIVNPDARPGQLLHSATLELMNDY
jgi:2-polyprenyl-6-methoxyphenol hydroxylase-like FAD-dependent oxidoreductase